MPNGSRCFRLFVPLVLGLLLVACASARRPPERRPAPPSPQASTPTVFFADALGKVYEQYVDNMSVESLGVAALHGLENVTPKGAIRVLANPRGATLIHGESGSEETTTSVGWRPNPRLTEVGRELEEAGGFVVQRLGVRPSEVIDAMLRGLISIDPKGAYFDPKEYRELAEPNTSGGVGVYLQIRERVLTVVSPFEGGPAEQSGLRGGDRILAIDGVRTEGLTLPVAMRRLVGEPGSRAELLIERNEWSVPRVVAVTRAVIKGGGVHRRLLGSVGYIRIWQLGEETAAEVRSSAQALHAEGAQALVLDLRGNRGGLLTAAIEVTQLFLLEGQLVVSTTARVPKQNMRFVAHPGSLRLDLPLALLVDGNTAAGSEIITSALQDWERATVVGTKTFADTTIQSLISLPNGGVFKLTTARWFTLKRREVAPHGIVPDVEVFGGEDGSLLGDPEHDVQLRRAVEIVGAKIGS